MQRWGDQVEIPDNCVLYGSADENPTHLFLDAIGNLVSMMLAIINEFAIGSTNSLKELHFGGLRGL